MLYVCQCGKQKCSNLGLYVVIIVIVRHELPCHRFCLLAHQTASNACNWHAIDVLIRRRRQNRFNQPYPRCRWQKRGNIYRRKFCWISRTAFYSLLKLEKRFVFFRSTLYNSLPIIHAHLFDGVESSPTSREIDRIGDVEIPRPISDERAHKAEREESEVAVRHVAILGVEQKPCHDGHLRVTEHDHCATSHSAQISCSTTAGTLVMEGSNL